MADFATNLAARALGVATTVRPRPASRFETELLDEPNATVVPHPPEAAARRVEQRSSLLPEPPAAPRRPDAPRSTGAVEKREALRELAPQLVERTVSVRTDAPPPPPGQRVDATPSVGTAETPRPSGEPVVVRAVRPAVAAAASSPPSRRSARRAEQPPVRVTIGRVEVRAVVPLAPPAPAPKPAPELVPLSLEEYLDQRRSGRR